jgi:regulator of protease activity HflC (stomatin/prohibitin superfamily)
MRYNERVEMIVSTKTIAIWSTVVTLVVIAFYMGVVPPWKVWAAQKDGEATLARAESARQVLVQQALAEKNAAQHRADAIKIVGQAAKDFPEYRKQEFIGAFAHALEAGKIQQIIYVPTEGNIPITEARVR